MLPHVFMDISVAGKSGRVVFELFANVVPKTAANFQALCTGANRAQLSFRGNKFHRVIKGFMCQAGDITKGDGTGGASIYGDKFKDEAAGLALKHDRAGLLSMANAGPDTNGSQFFVLLDEARHLDGKHVVFGRVVSGFSVIEAIAAVPTNASDRPKKACVIVDCGLVKLVSSDEARAKAAADEAAKAAARAADEDQRRLTSLDALRHDGDQTADSVAATVRQALLRKTGAADDATVVAKAAQPIKHMFDALDADADAAPQSKKKARRSVFGDDDLYDDEGGAEPASS